MFNQRVLSVQCIIDEKKPQIIAIKIYAFHF